MVDDERQIHASLRLRLGGTHELEFAFDAAGGLERLRQTRFDLCLADLHMPRMDGFAFIEAAQQVDPALGFVVLSAFDSAENLRRTIPLQVYDFISKPLPGKADFEGRIQEWVERTRQRRVDQDLARQAEVVVGEREAALAEGQPKDDALVPGTNYHAVGRLPCTLDGQPEVKDCEFGVTRGQPGIATVFITVPNGFVRVISFNGEKVSPDSAVTSFESSREDDNTRININGLDENYLIPDAVINGG